MNRITAINSLSIDRNRVNAVSPAAIEGAMHAMFTIYFRMTREQVAAVVLLGSVGKSGDVALRATHTGRSPSNGMKRRPLGRGSDEREA